MTGSIPRYTSTADGFRTAEEIAALRPVAPARPRSPREKTEKREVTSGIVCFCGERFSEDRALEFMLHLCAEAGNVLRWYELRLEYTRRWRDRIKGRVRQDPVPPRAARTPANKAGCDGITCGCGMDFTESRALAFMKHLRTEVGTTLRRRERYAEYARSYHREYKRKQRSNPEFREREREARKRTDGTARPRLTRPLTPEQAERKRERERKRQREHRKNPEYRERRLEYQRQYRARKKAEREAASAPDLRT